MMFSLYTYGHVV